MTPQNFEAQQDRLLLTELSQQVGYKVLLDLLAENEELLHDLLASAKDDADCLRLVRYWQVFRHLRSLMTTPQTLREELEAERSMLAEPSAGTRDPLAPPKNWSE